MFTLRFESDALGTDSDEITYMAETPTFRTRRHSGGTLDVLIPNENGVDIAHPIGPGPGCYHRCFVMNNHGKTVARFSYGPGAEIAPARAA